MKTQIEIPEKVRTLITDLIAVNPTIITNETSAAHIIVECFPEIGKLDLEIIILWLNELLPINIAYVSKCMEMDDNKFIGKKRMFKFVDEYGRTWVRTWGFLKQEADVKELECEESDITRISATGSRMLVKTKRG